MLCCAVLCCAVLLGLLLHFSLACLTLPCFCPVMCCYAVLCCAMPYRLSQIWSAGRFLFRFDRRRTPWLLATFHAPFYSSCELLAGRSAYHARICLPAQVFVSVHICLSHTWRKLRSSHYTRRLPTTCISFGGSLCLCGSSGICVLLFVSIHWASNRRRPQLAPSAEDC